MNKRLHLIVPGFLAVCALCSPLAAGSPGGDGSVGPAAGATAGGGTNTAAGRTAEKRSAGALRREYNGYANRLDALETRIAEDQSEHIYTAEEAAKHRADLEAIRARFRNITNRTRWLSAAQRSRIDSDIRSEEHRIASPDKP
jgi:hypothetical protein